MAEKKFEDYKAKTIPIYKDSRGSIQRLIPINRISRDGIFEIEDRPKDEEKTYDKCYLMVDTNYVINDEDEKDLFLRQWCKILNALNVSFKIIVMNNNRDMNTYKKDSFFYLGDNNDSDIFRSLKETFNEIIQSRAEDGAAGIEQVKLFVLTCKRQDFTAAKSYFRTMEANLIANFRKLDSGLIPLNAEERFRILHSFYRLGHEGEFHFDFEHMSKAPGKDWLNSIANLYMREEEEQIEFEDRIVRALYVRKFPNNSIKDEFVKHMVDLPVNMIMTVDVSAIPKDAVNKKLNAVYMQVNDSAEKTREQRRKNQQFDSELPFEKRKEMEKTEMNLDIARENDENMFYCGIYFLVTARDTETMESAIMNMKSIADSFAFELEPAYMQQIHTMNTALPTGAREVAMMRPLWTQPLAALLPFSIQELNDPGGMYYGVNSISKNVLFGKRQGLTNLNGFIFGVPGAGKSVTAKLTCVIEPALKYRDDDILIIDPKDKEYENVVKALGGQYITISAKTETYINPLGIENRHNYKSDERFIADKASLMLGIAEQIIDEGIMSGAKSIIIRCIQELYHRVFSEKEPHEPVMEEFYKILGEQPEEEARKIRLSFESFVHGTLNIFAKKSNVNMRNRIIGFDTSELGEELAPVGMLVTLESIRSRVMENKKHGITTWIVIDEFHHMTHMPYTARKVNEFWKEFRAMGGICTGITQNIVDITANPTIVSMVANSDFVIMLRQGETDKEVIQKVVGLNDNTLEFVTGADPGCGVIKFGTKIIPFENKLPKNTILYELVNTNFYEKWTRKKRKKLTSETASLGIDIGEDEEPIMVIPDKKKLDLYEV